MSLPNLSLLSLRDSDDNKDKNSVHAQWLQACGPSLPRFKKWKNVNGRDKRRLLHALAAEADDDDAPDGDYVTPYDEMDIDEVLQRRVWSVEHVIPRSHVRQSGSQARSDPLGWITATRRANSKRSNYPLVLWSDAEDKPLARPGTLVTLDGQLHFVPPVAQRARLARKWMYIRATYWGEIEPPSLAQQRHAGQIIELAKKFPIQPAERRMNELHKQLFNWSNPLLGDDAARCVDGANAIRVANRGNDAGLEKALSDHYRNAVKQVVIHKLLFGGEYLDIDKPLGQDNNMLKPLGVFFFSQVGTFLSRSNGSIPALVRMIMEWKKKLPIEYVRMIPPSFMEDTFREAVRLAFDPKYNANLQNVDRAAQAIVTTWEDRLGRRARIDLGLEGVGEESLDSLEAAF